MKSTPSQNKNIVVVRDPFFDVSMPKLRRLSTMPDTPSSYFNNSSSSLCKRTRNEILSKSFNLNKQSIISPEKRNNCQSLSHRSSKRIKYGKNRSNIELKSSKSTKSYGKIIAYGWSHLKFPDQRSSHHFTINLGPVKFFIMMETKNMELVTKKYCQYYQTQLTNLLSNFSMEKIEQILKILLQATRDRIILQNQGRVNGDASISILNMLVFENEIIIGSIGELNAYCFTKDGRLIDSSLKIQNPKQQIGAANITNYFSSKNKCTPYNKNKKATLLSYNNYLYEKQKKQIAMSDCRFTRFKIDDIVWVGMLSRNVNKNCPKQSIRQWVNKQFCKYSTTYDYNEIAMESCNKIINSLLVKNINQPMTALVIFFSQYPLRSDTNSIRSMWDQVRFNSRLKTTGNDNQMRQQRKMKPALLKYVGNRDSFIKCKQASQKIGARRP